MVILILGSKSDLDWGKEIRKHLENLDIKYKIHIASAHKTPQLLLDIIQKYEISEKALVYICVAGRSNALGGFVDAHTRFPVINCPPYSEKYAGLDILSSLRMPSGVVPLTVLEPEQAAFSAAKILGIGNIQISEKVEEMQRKMKEKIIADNRSLSQKV